MDRLQVQGKEKTAHSNRNPEQHAAVAQEGLMPCDICDNNWVCETHPDKPSDITSDRNDACHCGGAAMPCRACGGDFKETGTESD